MLSTMQDFPLTLSHVLRHGRTVHGADSAVVTATAEGARRASFAEVGQRIDRLAAALTALGVKPGERVGSLMWNCQEHQELYFAVPCMGAVLHTLNHRLFPEQLAYIVNHAEDRVLVVSDSLIPALAKFWRQLKTVEQVIVVGDGPAEGIGPVHRYDALIDGAPAGFIWPELDERSAAVMCYTSGTTGTPKGVAYSHRSLFLHALSSGGSAVLDFSVRDRGLIIVPMFHVNAWGYPYSCWFLGADMVLPDRFGDAASLALLLRDERPSFAAGAVTVWMNILALAEADPAIAFPSLKRIISGGSATPQALMAALERRFGAKVYQGWGMTETSSCSALAFAPKGEDGGDDLIWRARTGRVTPGIEIRIVDADGRVLPADGVAQGEIQVRGPWVTGRYYKSDDRSDFQDGWLRTGDMGTLDGRGYLAIHDRSKDAIKSGGEWISSIALENHLMAHPAVAEAAVIAVPDTRWQERPLAVIVVCDADRPPSPEVLAAFLADRVPKWWLPENWAYIDAIPKTAVGKFDKKELRRLRDAGALTIRT